MLIVPSFALQQLILLLKAGTPDFAFLAGLGALTLVLVPLHDVVLVLGGRVLFSQSSAVVRIIVPIWPIFEIVL